MSSHLHSSKTARRPPPSYDYITHIIKQEIRGVEERLRGEMSDRFDRVERKIDLFLQLAGQGGVQSERSKFDDRAFSKGNQQNKETRERDEVIIEECFHEEVTPNKQSEAFPTYDDGFLPDPSSAIVLYQQRPLVWTEETFRTEEARQDDVTEKVARTKEDSNISNKDDYEKPSTSSHVCQPSNEIIVIEDPNSELPVGRGHRVKRRAAVLLSPYTNPLKRRKLLNIQAYDPLREVDPAKVEDLNKWLANASTSDTVTLAICEVRRKFFDELLKDDGWLIDDHIDSALYHIRERAVTYPHIFQQDCAILDCYFWQLVKKAYLKMGARKKKNGNYVFDQELVDYVEGASPVLGKHWSNCKFLYVPYCVPGSHWFALKIDLTERTIYIYDSLPKHIRAAQLAECMKPIQVVIPLLIKEHIAREEKFSTSMFRYQRVVVPEQTNGSDCGLFTVKFIEFLQAQLNMDLIRPEYMSIWRNKLAAEIFAWHFDP
ncbi:uncharacterized protein LOC111409629 [Olea europaea var. sylvestris]|uniref:uncharacterized protein LOC111409629 n=1 Tax=Olea europaea var. sylvestris TaxID=158386 RepID=UPI000C1D0439|nr:uncharacterized protein LOC111409629 [Olea europaea var. sylvestris]